MSKIHHFEKISIVDGDIKVTISFDRYSKAFDEAQAWFGEQVLQDCRAVMPMKTGNFQQRSHTRAGGRIVAFTGPQGRFLYGGKVMVDPDTGSPWAKKGAKKVLTDRPLHYSRSEAVDHWFDEAKARNKDYWLNEIANKLGGRRK